MEKTHTIQLTHSQLINLKEFLEFNFIPCVRDDDTIDNINYLVDMCLLICGGSAYTPRHRADLLCVAPLLAGLICPKYPQRY